MYRRILVPLKKAGGPEDHLWHVAGLASKLGIKVILLCVITVIPSDEYFSQRIQVEEGSIGARRRIEAEGYLNGLEEELQGQGVTVESAVLISDKTEDEAIVDYAIRSDCDLIVLLNRRNSFVSRLLEGNVTAKVQRRSRIPILLITEEEDKV